MSDAWTIRVYDRQELTCTLELTGSVELGRQNAADEVVFSQRPIDGRTRVVIAPKEERTVSRRHALIAPLDDGQFEVVNLSGERAIGLPDGGSLRPGTGGRVDDDALLTLGHAVVRLQAADPASSSLHALAERTLAPGHDSTHLPDLAHGPLPAPTGIELQNLLRWLQAAMDVLQSAASSADFFDRAARAVVDLVHLDTGWVLLLGPNGWQTRAFQSGPGLSRESSRPPSRHVLQRVRQEKRTFWEAPLDASAGASLGSVGAVVAAPILNGRGEVIGALYGDRHGHRPTASGPVSEAEAMLVELLARGVAAGLARLVQEQAALAAQVRFEQFFTPELSRQLTRNPDLLRGRDAEVSILFCDIRGFSRVSERLGPARTVEWINDVLEALSDCVRAEAGVLVDYIGDELMAMWGAPEEQPDHADRACRAALAMLGRVPSLNERWQPILGEAMGLGVGVNTGPARVGNTGSATKFKYGPLGNTVNLASRVQGLTKYLRCRLLVSAATRDRLSDSFRARRVVRARVVNIAEPVDLCEVEAAGTPNRAEFFRASEAALDALEACEFALAARRAGSLLEAHNGDGPLLLVLSRAANMLMQGGKFDPVWEPPGK